MSTPRQPRTPQIRGPAPDLGARSPVPLGPHPGLDNPGPIHPPPARPQRRLHLRDRPTHRAIRAVVAEQLELLVAHIGADLAVGAVDPLLDLGEEHVELAGPANRLGQVAELAPVTPRDPVRHRVRRTPRQRASRSERAGQIECFKNLSHLLAILHISSSRSGVIGFVTDNSTGRSTRPGGPRDRQRTSPRASDGHQRAIPMTITARFPVRLRAESHVRRQSPTVRRPYPARRPPPQRASTGCLAGGELDLRSANG